MYYSCKTFLDLDQLKIGGSTRRSTPQAESRECHGRVSPSGCNFFFMQLLGNISQNIRLVPHFHDWPPSSGDSWICHCVHTLHEAEHGVDPESLGDQLLRGVVREEDVVTPHTEPHVTADLSADVHTHPAHRQERPEQ